MEVPAGLLFRRAAGMENRGAFRRRETSQIQFLECRRWHGRNLCPTYNDSRRKTPCFADFPVSGVVFELKREKLQSELIEHRVPTPGGQRFFAALTDWGIDEAMPSSRNGLAQSRGEG